MFKDLKDRGLEAPKLMIADGNAGAWAAVAEIWPESREQRCGNHKIANVLDQLPKKLQAMAREQLCAIPHAETKRDAVRQREAFAKSYRRPIPERSRS